MPRRIAAVLALATLVSAPLLARANEWEEDYSDEWSDDQAAPADDYPVSVDVDASVNLETFQGALSPYGEWVSVGTYGRVWRPHVAAGWRPYYYGRWEWTSEGWLWVSDEPWGWAAYHYGRWASDPYYGWVWVPGYQWAPAWVSWRYSGDVVGWAPLAPGVSVYVSTTPFIDTWWTFVPCTSFVAVPVYRVAYAPGATRRYFRSTVPAPPRPMVRELPGHPTPAPAWGGPPPRAIEQRIGRPVTPVRVVAARTPGAARVAPGEVSIYRPELRQRELPRPGDRRPAGPRGAEVAPRPGPRGFERPEVSTPAPAVRGDEGRVGPRPSPGPGAPRGAGTVEERAWTPRGVGGVARPEFHQNVIPPPARPEFRGSLSPVPARPEFRVGGGPGPRPEFRVGGGQPAAPIGGARRPMDAPRPRFQR